MDDKILHKKLASLPGVKAAVRETADRIEARAKADFAPHDNPGGHTIRSRNAGPDRLVYLTGPAPVALEYGHFTRARKGANPSWVEGLHIMGRAARGR